MAANRHLAAIAHDAGKFGQRRFFSAVQWTYRFPASSSPTDFTVRHTPDAQRLNTRDAHGGRRSRLMGGGWVGGGKSMTLLALSRPFWSGFGAMRSDAKDVGIGKAVPLAHCENLDAARSDRSRSRQFIQNSKDGPHRSRGHPCVNHAL